MSTDPIEDTPSPSNSLDEIDWANFHFPTRPGTRSTKELLTGRGSFRQSGAGLAHNPNARPTTTRAPTWAVPPTRIDSWHLDVERWLLSHPGQRKKVELLRLTSRRKLAMVVDLIAFQPTDVDQAALWRGLHNAIYMAFGVGLGEMLVSGPDNWEWPLSIAQGGKSGSGQGGFGQDSRADADTEEERAQRRMGLNGV